MIRFGYHSHVHLKDPSKLLKLVPKINYMNIKDSEEKVVKSTTCTTTSFLPDGRHMIKSMYGNKVVTFDDYMSFVCSMKVYPEKYAIIYPALGMGGESGEVMEKVKKWMRGDGNGELDKDALAKEIGDVLWYCASLADDLGFTFQDIVDINIEKLKSREERGVRKGSGDNR